ncbi:protein REDUCED WALL ACETYLATION 2 [Aplysia californica]|uniref:Protein REDUCED WALL ACETYLATION 2 n=1 Tax=Aplysia californica TaxID=6500 RepID=A0ABM1A2S3_APLCA|nr:protein REDUCED WALL ACETYLATION 2 [Aplysia californica]
MTALMNSTRLSTDVGSGLRLTQTTKALAKYTDRHAFPQHTPTLLQLTLILAYGFFVCVWVFHNVSERLGLRAPSLGKAKGKRQNGGLAKDRSEQEKETVVDVEGSTQKDSSGQEDGDRKPLVQNGVFHPENKVEAAAGGEKKLGHDVTATDRMAKDGNDSSGTGGKTEGSASRQSPQPPVISFGTFLKSTVLFGFIMIFFYLCDYVKIFPQGLREYDRDTFLFLVFMFLLVALVFTVQPTQDRILNRDQTEEWKGWMQVMFVWYHYFAAKEWYNWVRVYIACYVWMTGFGNFSFFWIRKDFSGYRIVKMLFRLNFLVIFVVMVTDNEYMLYYICAMHTYWFLTVYVFMRTFSSWNTKPRKMALKFLAYFVCNAIIFDIPGVSEWVFRPFAFVLGLHDNTGSIMHEWSFRAGLDHWACFVGMLCAYNYPHFEALMTYLDSQSHSKAEQGRKWGIRIGMAAVGVAVGFGWYFSFMQKDKYAYNRLHPYTSIIPILVFILLRNIHPLLRRYHIHMFAWLGKITLETYLSQLHVYLLSNARTLLVYLEGYPLINFSLATIIYLTISQSLFHITNDTSNFMLPRDKKKLLRNTSYFVCLLLVCGCLAYFVPIL